jgi:dynein intermediate chain
LDSTVKLWSTEFSKAPLFSFEPTCTEYVCDVRWSPIHPGLFAVVDGNGRIYLWNICKDLEVPLFEEKIAKKAINKIRWSQNGTQLFIGDAQGNLFVYDVPSQVSHNVR